VIGLTIYQPRLIEDCELQAGLLAWVGKKICHRAVIIPPGCAHHTKELIMEIMNDVKSPALQLDEAMYTALYDEVFPVIASLISRQGGSRSDAEDIFQDALIALLDSYQRTIIQDPTRYLVGIAKHLWVRKARTHGRFLQLDVYERSLTLPDEIASEADASTLLRFLQRAGAKCLDLLSDFYFAGLSVAEIASRHGFATVHSASVQKHKCLEKVRNIVKEKQLRHEDFVG